MKRTVLLIFALSYLPMLNGQKWTVVKQVNVRSTGDRNIIPESYSLVSVDNIAMKQSLWKAPMETGITSSTQGAIVPLMLRDGNMMDFEVVEYAMMEEALAAKYPDIKTFLGVSVSDPHITARMDYTVHGLRAVINNHGKKTYIDHYQREDKEHKVIYTRDELINKHKWECLVDKSHAVPPAPESHLRAGDCQFRQYQLAVTATGEYSNHHGATSAAQSNLVQSAVVTTINRVNQVFEIDLAVRMILIGNNDAIYYYNPATDPFTGSSSGAMINENQTNTDAVIGNANYDIGHIFSTGGSGLAQLRSLCNTGSKARGVTGIANPEGDPFDIDYVAHEMGHQYGGNHTQNNSCNRNNATAVEPGSASTIMGYAGICSPNVQNNSDDFFHAKSIEEMANEVVSESCDDVIAWGNTAPVIPSVANKTLPVSTSFVLDVIATDGDPMTYCWEQMDTEVASMPPLSINTGGPAFRSILPTVESARYFPKITDIVNNTNDIWEVLPSVSRNMNFRLTVRDAHGGMGGCTSEEDVTLTFDGGSGPFVVNTANAATTYNELETVEITWDVANTDNAPVSCANVDILMSYDGGLTYPITLLSNTFNNGVANIIIPNGVTTTGRFMVKCSDNYFFDINDANFVVNVVVPTFTLASTPNSATICTDINDYSFMINTASILSYNESIILSTIGLPAGVTASFSANPITPGQSSTVSLSNLTGATGLYTIDIKGTTIDRSISTVFNLTLVQNMLLPSLLSPGNNETGIGTAPTLSWNSIVDATSYDYEISTVSGAADVASGNISNTSITLGILLSQNTDYLWRVRSLNDCETTAWTAEFTFKTRSCISMASADIPKAIDSGPPNTINSTMSIRDRGVITEINIIDLVGDHTYMSDLTFTLTSPNTSVEFWTKPCGSNNDFDINFSADGAQNHPCPPTDGLTYTPDSPLTPFNSGQVKGNWILEIADGASADGGSLNGWGIEYCGNDLCDLSVSSDTYNGGGSLNRAIDCAIDGDTIWLENVIPNQIITIGDNTITVDKNVAIVADVPTTLMAQTTGPILNIASGKTVSLIGFTIINTSGSAIFNNGFLTLEDMTLTTDGNTEQVLSANSATITVKGICNLEVD